MKRLYLAGAFALAGCLTAPDTKARPAGGSERCTASVYWQGSRLATGERFNPHDVLVAHKTLRLGSRVRVTHLGSGRSVVAPVRDRGPYIRGRCVDLSLGAAAALGMGRTIAPVTVEVLD